MKKEITGRLGSENMVEEKNVELKLVDVYEGEDVENWFEEPLDLSSENVYVILAEIMKGEELITEGIEQGTTRTLFNDRDINKLDSAMLAIVVDYKDTFTGDQDVLMGLCNEHLEDIETEINQLF